MLSVCNNLAWITDASWERDGLFVQRDKCLCTPWQTREKRGVGALPPRKLLFCRRLKWRVHVFFFFFCNFLGFRLSQSLSQSGGKWELYSFFAALSVTQKTSWLVASLMSGVLSLRAVVWFLLYSGKRDRQCDYFGGYSNDTQYCCTTNANFNLYRGKHHVTWTGWTPSQGDNDACQSTWSRPGQGHKPGWPEVRCVERKCCARWAIDFPSDVYFYAGIWRNGTRNCSQKMLLRLIQIFTRDKPKI